MLSRGSFTILERIDGRGEFWLLEDPDLSAALTATINHAKFQRRSARPHHGPLPIATILGSRAKVLRSGPRHLIHGPQELAEVVVDECEQDNERVAVRALPLSTRGSNAKSGANSVTRL